MEDEMEIVLPAPQWAMLTAISRASGTFERGGRAYEVLHEKVGPWHPDSGPMMVAGQMEAVRAEAGTLSVLAIAGKTLFRQGLPLQRLTLAEAVAVDDRLQKRSSWRKKIANQTGLEGPIRWTSYAGHPVAVYEAESGTRWASLPFLLGSGAEEMLLDRSLVLQDEAEAAQVPDEARREAGSDAFILKAEQLCLF